MPQVMVIPPIAEQSKKLRVAAYARVSSDSADQLNSFATQVAYYTDFIQSKEEWEFAGLYADEAVSGTTAGKRDDFQRLLADCRAGKIDRILVKSISRFARNTIDCLQTVRELEQLGVTVEFEKEDIDTGNMGSEMLLSFLGSVAQEESLSISKSLKWSYRRRMESGDFITCSAPFGYRLEGNTLIPNPQEAVIVKYIFRSYLEGKSIEEIVRELNIRFPDSQWHYIRVRYILTNEKYIGDSLTQKKYTPDSFPLHRQKNRGQVKKYYFYNSHPGIIEKDMFQKTQELLKLKSSFHFSEGVHTASCFSKLIRCGICDSTLRRCTSKNGIYWTCRKHLKGIEFCSLKRIQEQEIMSSFLNLYHKLLGQYRTEK